MATITLSLPTSGTVVSASLHSNNYTAIQGAINGGLDNNNFAAGKIFDLTKLMQGGAATTVPLAWDGTNWSPASSGLDIPASASGIYRANQTANNLVIRNKLLVADAQPSFQLTGIGALIWGPGGGGGGDTTLYRDAAGNRLKTDDNFVAADGVTTKTKAGVPVDGDFQATPGDGTLVVDTTNALIWRRTGAAWVPSGTLDRLTAGSDNQTSVAEASFYTKSIPANLLGSNRMLRLTLMGDLLHNNVAGDTVTLKVKFGGTTFWAFAYNANATIGAARHPWVLVLQVMNLGATNSQAIFGTLAGEDGNAAAPTTGIGVPGANPGGRPGPFGISTLGAIDTTTAQTLDLTAQWSASSANNSWRTRGGVLEIV